MAGASAGGPVPQSAAIDKNARKLKVGAKDGRPERTTQAGMTAVITCASPRASIDEVAHKNEPRLAA